MPPSSLFASMSPRLALAALPLFLAACASGTREAPAPRIELPPGFHHANADRSAPAAPIDPEWWRAYGDPELDALLRRVAESNPELARAEARWRQARAQVDAARALALPQLGAGASVTRRGGGASTGARRLYDAGLDLSWAPDLWGRAARSREAAAADADAQAALLDAARLALQLAAAQGYVRLRALDAQLALQAEAEVAYTRSLQITRLQYEAGLVARADVIQADTQLQSLRTQAFTLQRQRALEANALALLAGATPTDFPVAAREGALPAVPPVPAALPAELLRRRPDLAAAGRQLAAAHARLGLAQTAWLPDLTLSASAGWQSTGFARLLDAPSRVWSLGPRLAATLFDGGARRANEALFGAAYDEQAAAWRAGVLAAVRETEDALAQLATLAEQERQQARLVELASENERVVGYRYEAGEISFLEVATAQNLALSARRAALDVRAQRLAASMALVAALGGGWQPTP
ncbi:efflux transporter outer membrane subunit [Hydrogenophaga sp. SNF1]|uniref:efflux transporter outer membrane subunit n=1 Tax=Hydrogenophaga sp. SNF1 TaxID=3098762 RepID=UPI002ACBE4AF|nr:efflux transporter outer membrane subunit [Hydrogenophaga sp. SNF1]WQB83345.1 efflux transporter outer membrane subunit [Hydrogenophaga sp. SNF1]